MSLSTRAHFHHWGAVAAMAVLSLAAGLALAAGPKSAKAEEQHIWLDLPSKDQVKRVYIKKIEPSEAEPFNAEIRFELGEGTRVVLSRIANFGVPAAPGDPATGKLLPGG